MSLPLSNLRSIRAAMAPGCNFSMKEMHVHRIFHTIACYVNDLSTRIKNRAFHFELMINTRGVLESRSRLAS